MTSLVPCEYIWLDAKGTPRSKTRMLPDGVLGVSVAEDLPSWQYDGSSTGQAELGSSDVLLRPVRIFRNPFSSSGRALWILCETFADPTTPHPTNYRARAREVFAETSSLSLQFGFEQEFFCAEGGFNEEELSLYSSNAYCGAGYDAVRIRGFMEEAERHALGMGLSITGKNMEVVPGQGEFQVFGSDLNACDHLVLLRYLLLRQGEVSKLHVTFAPKPYPSLNGSGCHTNISTAQTRSEGGLEAIHKILQHGLMPDHTSFMEVWGEDNDKRMTGDCETSDPSKFTWNERNRGASVRIPLLTVLNGKGYFEDRRPASSMDPYQVSSHLAKSIKKGLDFDESQAK